MVGHSQRSGMFGKHMMKQVRSPLEQAKRADWSLKTNSLSSRAVGYASGVFGTLAAHKSKNDQPNFEVDILKKHASLHATR